MNLIDEQMIVGIYIFKISIFFIALEAPNKKKMATYQQPGSGEFQNSLCSCYGSCSDCALGYFCPSCYAYCTAQAAGEGMVMSVLNCLLYPLCVPCLRLSAREKQGIDGNFCTDLCCLFCPCCAYVQINREFQ